MSFVFFVLFQNTFKIDVFEPNLVKNVSSKKNKKDHDFCLFWSFLIFFVLFCCFCRIWLTKCPQTENKKEQKRSCRRENRKMSFVFFVVGPPPPPISATQCFTFNRNSVNDYFTLLVLELLPSFSRHVIPISNSFSLTFR